jgi:hypothetical protein
MLQTMNEQLPLIGTENHPWAIDPHTRQVGLEGLRQARAALAGRPAAERDSHDSAPARPAAA